MQICFVTGTASHPVVICNVTEYIPGAVNFTVNDAVVVSPETIEYVAGVMTQEYVSALRQFPVLGST